MLEGMRKRDNVLIEGNGRRFASRRSSVVANHSLIANNASTFGFCMDRQTGSWLTFPLVSVLIQI